MEKAVSIICIMILSYGVSYAQGSEKLPRILHFYRDKDFGMLNRYAKIIINEELKMRMRTQSYDTIIMNSNSDLELRTNKEIVKIDGDRVNYYLKIEY